MVHALENWIFSIADSWWVHVVVLACAWADGFFPTVPSESVVVTLSSLWSSAGRPWIVGIALAAWSGAFLGDNTAYLIGRRIGWQRFRFLREGKGFKAVEAADRGLQRRALLFLMTARYIPFGRTAVNLVAGAVRYPHQKFWHRSLISTLVWSIYSCLIGAVAGSWFENNHLLAVTVALVAAVVTALVAERLVNALNRWMDARAERRERVAADIGRGEAERDQADGQLEEAGGEHRQADGERTEKHPPR